MALQEHIWRFLSEPPQSAAVNMASDEAIAIAFSEGKVPPTLRFYRWSHPSFSIGAFQKLSPEWITHLEKQCEYPLLSLVRRITGGRGLLHDRELTYSVVSSTKDPLFSSGIKGTFYAIAKGLLAGLTKLGVDAEVYSPSKTKRREGHKDPLCFAATSWYEIVSRGKKMIGSAQRRWTSHFLQHGSLIIEKSPIAFSQNEWERTTLISRNQTTLSDLLPLLPSYSTLMLALKEGFKAALPIRLVSDRITAYEREIVNRLVLEKYDNPRWNFYRDT